MSVQQQQQQQQRQQAPVSGQQHQQQPPVSGQEQQHQQQEQQQAPLSGQEQQQQQQGVQLMPVQQHAEVLVQGPLVNKHQPGSVQQQQQQDQQQNQHRVAAAASTARDGMGSTDAAIALSAAAAAGSTPVATTAQGMTWLGAQVSTGLQPRGRWDGSPGKIYYIMNPVVVACCAHGVTRCHCTVCFAPFACLAHRTSCYLVMQDRFFPAPTRTRHMMQAAMMSFQQAQS
jgi:hypothetical protein